MTHRGFLLVILALSLTALSAACERNQDRMTPAAKTEEGKKAEDYPSARNAEKPDASVGGTNSATSGDKTTRQVEAPPPAVAPSGGR